MATVQLQIDVDEKLKNDAAQVFNDLGLDISTAIRIFLKRSVLENGIPFSMTLPKQDYKATRVLRLMHECSVVAQESGISNMTLEEINAEIDASRREQAAREKSDK